MRMVDAFITRQADHNRFKQLDEECHFSSRRGKNEGRQGRQSLSQDRQLQRNISTESINSNVHIERGRGYRGRGRGDRGIGGTCKIKASKQASFRESTQNLNKFGRTSYCSAREKDAETRRGIDRGRARGRGQNSYIQASRQTDDNTDVGLPEKRRHVIGFKQLDDLVSKEASDIILSLVEPRSGLQERLEKPKLEPDLIFLLLKVLGKALKSNIHPENQNRLMGILIESNMFAVHVPIVVTSFIMQKSEQNVFQNLAHIFQAFFKRMPVAAAEKLIGCVKFCSQIISSQGESVSVQQEVKNTFDDIEAGMQGVLDEKTKDANELLKAKRGKEVVDDEPPDDFREIPVTPFIDEITTNIKPFLRKNIIDGRYKNPDHYLDVQFRLLREDFVAPLRQGINDYLHQNSSDRRKKKGKIRDIRVYEGVQILEPICNRDGIYHKISFDTRPLQRIRWEASRRLLHGSLVCLSADNFKTVNFATVTLRNADKLKDGIMGVKFEGKFDEELEMSKKERSHIYVMAESQAYFEAYRHILRGLQMVNSDMMPLAEYIVYVQNFVEPPKYIGHNSKYDFSCILDKPVVSSLLLNKSFPTHSADETDDDDNDGGNQRVAGSHQTCVLDSSTWPSSVDLGLDDSQTRAMHLALTSSLAIIQGPPGTGKTYIGLKIVKTLLSNRNVWKTKDAPAPILVVCYTNHALDQFLVGMLPFTKRLVRVGGRSKNEKLERFNIRFIRDQIHTSRLRASNIHFNAVDLQYQLRMIRTNLEHEKAKIQLLTTRVLHEKSLQKLTGGDNLLVRSLQEGFEEIFGVNPDHQQWSPRSFLAAWLGLTLENFVTEDEIDEFYYYDEDDVQEMGPGNKPIKGQPGAIALPEAGFAEVEPLDNDDDLIEIEDGEIFEQHNRLVDEEAPIVETLGIPESACDWAMTLEQLSDPLYHFPNEVIPPPLLAMYGAMGRVRRVIAERELIKTESMDENEANGLAGAWMLPLPDRWRLYRRWVSLFRASGIAVINKLQADYMSAASRLKEVMNGEVLAILRQNDVVGMTTTGAAKYHQVLQEIGAKIVIVEEAAEVLESHIVTTLSPRTEHLILIGDHMQLRPTTAVYKLATDYNLEISLFERMIKNGIRFETLQLQHRMRPEISRLIVPLIYPNLEDHPSVRAYPEIKGVSTSVFFLNHNNKEEAVADSMTHANQFEAEFLVGLCFYLLQQGYERDKITILTTYAGQLFALRKLMKKDTFEGVRVMVVDNYQGEENDIILLSFVRSNEEGKIGFLKIQNRVNVALSRARHGLYCIGNFSLFACKSDFWRRLVVDLERDEKIGNRLLLKCQKHHQSLIAIANGKDFREKCPEGGCSQMCNETQFCGHLCLRMCHLDAHLKCTQRCPKILCTLNHQCPSLCYQDCPPCNEIIEKPFPTCGHSFLLPCHRDISKVKCKRKVKRILEACGHEVMLECHIDPIVHTCCEKVERILPHCQHKQIAECFLDPAKIKCLEECDYRLDCGHRCPRKCHPIEDIDHVEVLCNKPCQRKICARNHKCKMRCCQPCNKCRILVVKKLPCGHEDHVACFQPAEDVTCNKRCQRVMACGHPCKLRCKNKCGHCEVMVDKPVPNCGHVVKMKCMDDPAFAMCNKKCNRRLPCGHPCSNRCSDPCTEKCEKSVPFKGLCGHSSTVPCHASCNTDVMLALFCQEPCTLQLPCDHKCKGTCGQCRQGRLHIPCLKNCGRIQICGHECQTPCSEACIPCKRKCETRCIHSRCPKRCGQPCKRCWELCPWNCVHLKCDKFCWKFCTRSRCNEPCPYKLLCGHPCIGLCKEKCPKLCRICNHEELTEFILSGFEEEEGARFIQLEDCGHCIEVQALDHFMDMDAGEIQMKGCPRCKTTIWRSQRYGNIIRQRMADVHKVKKQLYGSNTKLRSKMNHLQNQLKVNYNISTDFRHEYDRLVQKINQKFTLHQNELVAIENQINILALMMSMKDKLKAKSVKAIEYFNADIKLLGKRLMKNEERITECEVKQIIDEIRRVFLQAIAIDVETQLEQQGHNPKAGEHLALAKQRFILCGVLTEKDEAAIKTELETAVQLKGGLGITEMERVEIVKAMGFTQGHWFKCRNGHVYAIGDCGGAMEVSTCNECGVPIGGQNHALLRDNAHDGEMDGSRHGAWSEGANMMNYHL